MKEYYAKDLPDMSKQIVAELTTQLEAVQEEMASTMDNFSNTLEPDLLDYYTYQYKAHQIKYGYLLKKLKKIYYEKNLS
jgi:hypothetical protein